MPSAFADAEAIPTAGLKSRHLLGWDRRNPMYERAEAAAVAAASSEPPSRSEVDPDARAEAARANKLVQTKLLEKFAVAVAQRGGVTSLRNALRYADTNGDGTWMLPLPLLLSTTCLVCVCLPPSPPLAGCPRFWRCG